jgi:hypothetical protein
MPNDKAYHHAPNDKVQVPPPNDKVPPPNDEAPPPNDETLPYISYFYIDLFLTQIPRHIVWWSWVSSCRSLHLPASLLLLLLPIAS